MDISVTLQIVMMACGVYMCYWAVQMKISNEIPTVLVGKGYSKDRAKDPAGFIKKTFPYTFLTGVIIFAASILNAIRIFEAYPLIEFLFNTVCVSIIIIYAVFLTKAQRKYLFGTEVQKKKK